MLLSNHAADYHSQNPLTFNFGNPKIQKNMLIKITKFCNYFQIIKRLS